MGELKIGMIDRRDCPANGRMKEDKVVQIQKSKERIYGVELRTTLKGALCHAVGVAAN